jgi:EamA domain-containing membrane protein RarD
MTVWPLAMLAGWLTVAAPLNLITVATGNDWLPEALSPTAWASLAIALVAVIALVVTRQLRTMAYGIPIAWGLLGAFVAEQTRNPVPAYVALAAGVAVLVGAVLLAFSRRPRIERPAA